MKLTRRIITVQLCTILAATAADLNEGQEDIKPGRGDLAPNLALTEIFEGKKMTLESQAGKFVYIDFWATWCPPCQDVMKHLNEEGPAIQKQWPDKVVLMGISTDKNAKTANKHCAKRGWDKILQTHASDSDAFNIDGIPTAFLIGPDRKILWRGHPAEFELKQVLEKLIGQGAQPAAEAVGIAAPKPDAVRKRRVGEAFPVVDDAAIVAAIKREASKLSGAAGVPAGAELRRQLQQPKPVKPFSAPDLPMDSPNQLYERSGKSVLVIARVGKCDDCNEWHVSSASGFVVSTTGIAATNYHVMDDSDGSVVLAINRDLEVFPVSAILAADKDADCVLLQLGDGTRNDFTPLSLAPRAAIGESVAVISHPDENFFVMTRGIAARYAYTEETGKLPWLCVTAEYAKGSSGAPVLNDRGQVVGMVSSTNSIYYSESGKRQKDLQMVMRHCVPSSAIRDLSQPETN